jgi:hypothetical protein
MCVLLQNEIPLGILFVMLIFSSITKGALLPSKTLSLEDIHLVRCLTYISSRYFTPSRTVVITSPATYRDVQQELIAEILQTSTCPVVVNADGDIRKTDETYFIGRGGNYIILLPDGDIKRFVAEINDIAAEVKISKRLWNSRARFVVARASEFSTSQQTEIFHSLSELRIYNCIIASMEHYDIDKKHNSWIKVNVSDTDMKLGVYTWFPYQSSDRCTEVKDISLLDSWVISAQGHFTKNTNLFPEKISNNLNGCPMKAVIHNAGSKYLTNYFKHAYSNSSFVWYIEGMEYELLRVVLHQMNMTMVHVPTPEEAEWYSNLKKLEFGKETYISIGGHVKTFNWNSYYDLSSSYLVVSIRWYVPCSIKYPRWNSILRILSVELWLVLIVSIAIAAISIKHVGLYSWTSEWQVYKTLTGTLTNVWAVVLGVSVSTMPRTPSLRSLFFAWVCFSLAFSTVFQAFLTTFLIDSGYKTQIKNTDEMFASGIKLAFQREHYYFFYYGDEMEASNVYKNFEICPSLEVCISWAKYHRNVSFLMPDHFAEHYYANGFIVGENSEKLVCKLEDGVLFQSSYTMLLSHGDPLTRRVNEIIDRVVQAGIYSFWISLYMNQNKLYSKKIALVHPLDGYYSFKLYHLQPAFYLLLMGWCLSVLCFMVELLYNRVLGKINGIG